MTSHPLPYEPAPPPSPGYRWSVLICWLVIAAVVATELVGHAAAAARTLAHASTSDRQVPNFTLEMLGRSVVDQANPRPGKPPMADTLRSQLRGLVAQAAASPNDRLQAAVLTRELDGPAAAAAAVERVAAPAVADDAAALLTLYRTDDPTRLAADQRSKLHEHLGWLGTLAATQGRAADPAGRAAIVAAARRSVLVFTLAGVGILLAVVAGVGVAVVLVVLFSTGKLRFAFRRPAPVRWPAFLEAFAGWLPLVFFAVGVAVRPLHPSVWAGEGVVAAVTVAVVTLWPRFRGASWADVRQALGWHVGRGVLTEAFCGVVGYVAGLPVVAVGVVVTLLLTKVGHTSAAHPLQQEFGDAVDTAKAAGLLLAAAVLAPLLEETMFRGALYAHLRRRAGPVVSGGLVAVVFAAIHPQGWAGIPVLAAVAAVLAFLREWRGSLVASVVAHGLNNGAIVLLMVAASR